MLADFGVAEVTRNMFVRDYKMLHMACITVNTCVCV